MKIFENENLEQPFDTEYLWRFIKPKHLDHFLDNKLYFAQLFEYDDFYEAIDPTFYLLIRLSKRLNKLSLPDKPLVSVFKRAAVNFEWTFLIKYLKTISGLDSEERALEYLKDSLKKIDELKEIHNSNQRRIYASCWFIGDLQESAMMWSSYSEKGGVAVRIAFQDFKQIMSYHFNTLGSNLKSEIKYVQAGKIKYRNFVNIKRYEEFQNGTPASFFKHHSFKGENEYRIVIERYQEELLSFEKNQQFDQMLFSRHFEFILHPSARDSDYNSLKSKLNGQRINYSDLHWRV